MNLNELAQEIRVTNMNNGFFVPADCADWLHVVKCLALIHTEVSEAIEELRRNEDPKLKLSYELADIIIRTLDLAAGLDIDIKGCVEAKIKYNETRVPLHGKKF